MYLQIDPTDEGLMIVQAVAAVLSDETLAEEVETRSGELPSLMPRHPLEHLHQNPSLHQPQVQTK